MPRYYHEYSHYHQRRFIRIAKILSIIFLVGILGGGGYFAYDTFMSNRKSQQASAPTTETHAIFAPQSEIFQTQYYQFQADKHWAFIASESNDTKFVYRSLRNTIVEQDLTITINGSQPIAAATRVLPVTVDTDNSFTAGRVSEQCAKAVPVETNPHRIPQRITFHQVEFLCSPDTASLYDVTVGIKDGASPMVLRRANGTAMEVRIFYRNLKSEQNDEDIVGIMNTFQTR
jgi:hypothetical protein